MRTVSDCQIPRCFARQVTSSPGPIRPEVTPAIARSPVREAEDIWRSMLRERSKTRSTGAAIDVASSMTGIAGLDFFCQDRNVAIGTDLSEPILFVETESSR